jgi:hypothetical protein
MAEALFTLGAKAKCVLDAQGTATLTLERRPPKQLEHLLGINDVRIAAELTDGLSYFFACWELPALKWPHPIIPDCVLSLHNNTWAVEFDRGLEGLRFFLQTKVPAYERGLPGVNLAGVLVVAEQGGRMESLARTIGKRSVDFVFTTLDAVRRNDLAAPVFCRPPREGAAELVEGLSRGLLSAGGV